MSEKPNDKTPDKPEVRYVPIEYLPHMQDDDDEIDLRELIRTIWEGRIWIYRSVAIFIVLGLIIALGSREEYTSEVKLLPESQQQSRLGGLGSLAQQFWGTSSTSQAAEGIPTDLYPDLIQSHVLLYRLRDYQVNIPDENRRVSLYDYFQNHIGVSIASVLRRYTIGLPGVVRRWIQGTPEEQRLVEESGWIEGQQVDRIIRMTREEWRFVRNMRGRITASMQSGVLRVSVKMPDPEIAAEVADEVVQLVTEYITNYRTEKARKDMEFIESRYEEARNRFQQAQERLARFRDENRGQLTELARTEEQRLQSEYNLAFNLYNSMAERLEEARIKLQEDTPVVNVLEPAAVSDQQSEPKRILILVVCIILGVMTGIVWIFISPFMIKNKK